MNRFQQKRGSATVHDGSARRETFQLAACLEEVGQVGSDLLVESSVRHALTGHGRWAGRSGHLFPSLTGPCESKPQGQGLHFQHTHPLRKTVTLMLRAEAHPGFPIYSPGVGGHIIAPLGLSFPSRKWG